MREGMSYGYEGAAGESRLPRNDYLVCALWLVRVECRSTAAYAEWGGISGRATTQQSDLRDREGPVQDKTVFCRRNGFSWEMLL